MTSAAESSVAKGHAADRPLVLVVDDDKSSLRLLAGILEERGFEVMFGTRGSDALYVAGDGPDLILLDYELPDMNGLEVCRKLKADPAVAGIPVIFITASQDPLLEAEGLEAGAVDFVTKPYSAAVLSARVNTHIQLKRKTDLLEALAQHDGLTGAANRRYFDDMLQIEWARAKRNQSSISLVMIDIDHFKEINDTYGHQEGDRCLRELAPILERHLKRAGDLAARYGGEEFVLLLPDVSAEGVSRLAELLRSEVETEFARMADERGGPRLTASFGCATANALLCDSPEDLLRQADRNLYAAKQGGRNRVVPPPVP